MHGDIIINGIHYRWQEMMFGRNRGIQFNPNNHTYTFNPNPHNDAWYANNIARWYQTMTKQIKRIGDAAHWQNNWPNHIEHITVNNVEYTLNIH